MALSFTISELTRNANVESLTMPLTEYLEPSEQAKWDFLRRIPQTYAQDPGLIGVMQHFAAVTSVSPFPEWCFAQLALALVRDCIQYELDNERVGREQIYGFTDPPAPALMPLVVGKDDCDAKAPLFVALCLARGIEAEVWPRAKNGKLSHVYARVFLRSPKEHAPRWHWAETILRRARLGDIAEAVPKEPETGKWAF